MGSRHLLDVLADNPLHYDDHLRAEDDIPMVSKTGYSCRVGRGRGSNSMHLFSLFTFLPEQYVQTEREERFVLLSDASTPVLDWQSFSNDELQDELAFRLSDHQFAMTSRTSVRLVRCFDRKDTYKAWGATYNGDANQWYFPPGTDLRSLIRAHPEWIHSPELLRRQILLRIMSEVECSPFLRT